VTSPLSLGDRSAPLATETASARSSGPPQATLVAPRWCTSSLPVAWVSWPGLAARLGPPLRMRALRLPGGAPSARRRAAAAPRRAAPRPAPPACLKPTASSPLLAIPRLHRQPHHACAAGARPHCGHRGRPVQLLPACLHPHAEARGRQGGKNEVHPGKNSLLGAGTGPEPAGAPEASPRMLRLPRHRALMLRCCPHAGGARPASARPRCGHSRCAALTPPLACFSPSQADVCDKDKMEEIFAAEK
jgi:hypothetical protein